MSSFSERVNVLIVGVDAKILKALKSKNRYDDGCYIRSETPKLDIISIPRDTRTIIRGYKSQDKINHAHVYGGIELSMKTVKDLWEYRFIITLELTIMHLEKSWMISEE